MAKGSLPPLDGVLEMGLDGKAAIVTGGGSAGDGIGNGRAAAILLGCAGVRVLVVDRDPSLAQGTVDMIEAQGGAAAIAHGADVTDEAQCKAMAEAALDHFGRLDFLDNNVGISGTGSVVDFAVDAWRDMMRINVDAMMLSARHAIPAMRRGGEGGAIVNVASISAIRPRGNTAYSTSKGAVISLTKAMAVDHGREGIRVNCVAPGPVFTPMVYGKGMSQTARDRRREASPLGIEGSGWDVGHAVRFLLSGHSRYITGQTLVVDGGITLLAPAREHDGG